MPKKEYSKPNLEKLGSVASFTLTDAAQPLIDNPNPPYDAGTPPS